MNESRDQSSALYELARRYGVRTSYLDAHEALRYAEPDVIVALLRSLGLAIDGPVEASRELAALRRRQVQRMTASVLVVREAKPVAVNVSLPERLNVRSAFFTMRYEDGGVQRWPLSTHADPYARVDVEGDTYLQYCGEIAQSPRHPMPWGYHHLQLEVTSARGTAMSSTLVVSAPRCPTARRGWGLFMPQHALRTESDWGVGSYSDLAALGAWTSGLGGSMIGGLPLYPTYLDPPADPSPYRPVSRLAYNELYVDARALPEFAASPYARALTKSAPFASSIDEARASHEVNYGDVALHERRVMEILAREFFSEPSSRHGDYQNFMSRHPELLAYANFRASVDQYGREATLSRSSLGRPADLSPDLVEYHAYAQWVASEQLDAAGGTARLYSDLPVGSHPEGFDPWWAPDAFLSNCSVGAPPDLFFSNGQDWAIPPLNPEGVRHDDYRFFRLMVQRAVRHAGFLRIDHVMGLDRLYLIPDGAEAPHGAYVSYPTNELHAILALEAHRAGTVVIGEDLGTVEDDLRERLADERVLRSWVFQFESTTDDPLPEPPKGVLASLNTHDLPRFSAYLWGREIDEHEREGTLSAADASASRHDRRLYREALFDALHLAGLPDDELTSESRRRCLEYLGASDALLVLVDLEDLWGEDEPQNRPGTATGNWMRRGRLTLGEAEASEDLVAALTSVSELRQVFGS